MIRRHLVFWLGKDLLFDVLQKLNNRQGSVNHPALHVFYMDLGINYAELAQQDLKSGDLKGARVALDKLSQVLPELSAEDRETLTNSFRGLQEELQRKLGKRQVNE